MIDLQYCLISSVVAVQLVRPLCNNLKSLFHLIVHTAFLIISFHVSDVFAVENVLTSNSTSFSHLCPLPPLQHHLLQNDGAL